MFITPQCYVFISVVQFQFDLGDFFQVYDAVLGDYANA